MTDVFLFASQSLFGSAIKHLLDAAPGVVVVGWDDNAERAAQQIQAAHPAVIVVVAAAQTQPPAWLGSSPARVVTVSLKDSTVVASTGESCLAEDVGDFIRQLRDQSMLHQ